MPKTFLIWGMQFHNQGTPLVSGKVGQLVTLCLSLWKSWVLRAMYLLHHFPLPSHSMFSGSFLHFCPHSIIHCNLHGPRYNRLSKGHLRDFSLLNLQPSLAPPSTPSSWDLRFIPSAHLPQTTPSPAVHQCHLPSLNLRIPQGSALSHLLSSWYSVSLGIPRSPNFTYGHK